MKPIVVVLMVCALAPGCSAQEAGSQGTDRPPAARQEAVSAVGEMTTRRAAHTATLLDDGEVLISGGFVGDGAGLSSTELFDPASNEFRAGPSMSAARISHTATKLPDGRVLIAGGFDGDYLSSAEIYDPATRRFQPVAPMRSARSGHSATLLKDGRVLLAGGTGTGWTFLSSAELFDPKTSAFTPTGAMAAARESHTATLLADGRVLVAGGHEGRRPSVTIHASTEIYDPAAGAFSAGGNLTRRRHKHEATLLADGRLLISGGSDERDGRGAYRSVEIRDPATGAFAATGDMNMARYKHQGTSVLLGDGRVLIAGGASRPETYDPSTGTFAVPPGGFGTDRFFATATRLRDGDVLILGGYDDSNAATARAWRFRD